MKRLIQITIFLGMGIMARSQGIDSIVVSNATPTWNDTIEVICYATYPTFGCPLDSSTWFGAGNNAYILQAWHCMGPLLMLCATADTFNLPMPVGYPGNYTIYYMTGYVTDTAKPWCNYPVDTAGNPPPYPYAIDYTEITVTPPVGMTEQTPATQIGIYPNPARSELYIKGSFDIPATFELYDITGRKVLSQNITSNQPININPLSQGLYVWRLGNVRGKLIKQ